MYIDGCRSGAFPEAKATRRRAVLRAGRLSGCRPARGGADGRGREGTGGSDPPPARRCAPQARGQGVRLRARTALRPLPADRLAPPEGAARGGDRGLGTARPVGLLLRESRIIGGPELVAVLRPHLALTVSDVEHSLAFYSALFGVEPTKVRPGYAKFELAEPALNLTLNEGARSAELGAFNHAGIQVSSTDGVLMARMRLQNAGLATFDEMDTTCCYARQDKIWVQDPDGTPWEVFVTHEDSEERGEQAACA